MATFPQEAKWDNGKNVWGFVGDTPLGHPPGYTLVGGWVGKLAVKLPRGCPTLMCPTPIPPAPSVFCRPGTQLVACILGVQFRLRRRAQQCRQGSLGAAKGLPGWVGRCWANNGPTTPQKKTSGEDMNCFVFVCFFCSLNDIKTYLKSSHVIRVINLKFLCRKLENLGPFITIP